MKYYSWFIAPAYTAELPLSSSVCVRLLDDDTEDDCDDSGTSDVM